MYCVQNIWKKTLQRNVQFNIPSKGSGPRSVYVTQAIHLKSYGQMEIESHRNYIPGRSKKDEI